MSEKKSGSEIVKRHKEVYRRIVRVYEKLKEGPASVKELADKLKNDSAFAGIAHATIDKEIRFALSVLKGIEVVEERKDGKYRVVRRKIILKDDALRNVLLQHSKYLLSDFLAILGRSYFKLPDPSEIFSNEKYKYLLEHLKTGYPEIYSNMEEMIRIKEEIQDLQKEICEKIRDYLLEYNIPIEVEKEVESGRVYSAISSMFGGSGEVVRSEEVVDDRIRDVVKLCLIDNIPPCNIDCLPDTLDMQKTEGMVQLLIEDRGGEVIFAWLKPDLIEAINKALSLDSIRITYEKLKENERNYEERRKRYEEDMKKIVTDFQNGFPLLGRCDICRDYLEDLSEKGRKNQEELERYLGNMLTALLRKGS
ncbi:MAG: hypothetical protein DSO07_03900 [Thermoproteota archaeon]|jgi:hypothetical protein|uniref:Uncharacterized protein n=1 Tax=Candidatus Methanodesulfokora washburnensis TaxID=2478471 RepID=A0A429GRG8_9CREN|nr:hypothetical protein [Candidatus Methanodesulfokores washburnensis]RSN76293.1 hypothetical protein D6D85_04925 [Candidatus Methanodesulfokores washburnensis]TDA41569.1 MAG: hypothetical protein DSO07_03900 [Candidatus Korarchaeota archaeon]